jgi:hypothetical protein
LNGYETFFQTASFCQIESFVKPDIWRNCKGGCPVQSSAVGAHAALFAA